MLEDEMSVAQLWLHLGQTCWAARYLHRMQTAAHYMRHRSHARHMTSSGAYLYMMLCRMEAKGVTPIPAPMRTACSAWKM